MGFSHSQNVNKEIIQENTGKVYYIFIYYTPGLLFWGVFCIWEGIVSRRKKSIKLVAATNGMKSADVIVPSWLQIQSIRIENCKKELKILKKNFKCIFATNVI